MEITGKEFFIIRGVVPGCFQLDGDPIKVKVQIFNQRLIDLEKALGIESGLLTVFSKIMPFPWPT